MSGDPPASTATYIIICSGRINEAVAKNTREKIQALSNCAAQLTSHVELANLGKVKSEDTQKISDLQHFLMDNMESLDKDEVEESAKEMFRLLYALEEKFSGEHSY